jgi:hypothetical protein
VRRLNEAEPKAPKAAKVVVVKPEKAKASLPLMDRLGTPALPVQHTLNDNKIIRRAIWRDTMGLWVSKKADKWVIAHGHGTDQVIVAEFGQEVPKEAIEVTCDLMRKIAHDHFAVGVALGYDAGWDQGWSDHQVANSYRGGRDVKDAMTKALTS